MFHNISLSHNSRMESVFSEFGMYVLAAAAVGAVVGWLLCSTLSRSSISRLNDDWQTQLDDVVRQKDRMTAEATTLRTSIEAQEAVIHRRDMAVTKIRTELNSALEKEKLLTKNIFTLRAEREDFKTKVVAFQNAPRVTEATIH